MSCTGWRLGLSPVLWPSIRSRKEQPISGTDCTSRKCKLPGGIVRRYTICRVPGHLHPRLRIYDDAKMTASMSVESFEWGKRYVDRILGGNSLQGRSRIRRVYRPQIVW